MDPVKWSWVWCFIILLRQSIYTCFWHNYFITEIATSLHQSNVTYKCVRHWSISATRASLVRSLFILALSLHEVLPGVVTFSMSFIHSKPEITRQRCQELSQYQLEAIDCQGFHFLNCNFKREIYYLVFSTQEFFPFFFLKKALLWKKITFAKEVTEIVIWVYEVLWFMIK